MAVKFLSFEDILKIHSFVVDETGGRHGVRDRNALFSVAELPKQEVFGKVLYPTIFSKAAVYVRGIIQGHPFTDGNKRTGMTAAFVFLENNGYIATAVRGEIEKFALEIISKKIEIPEIASWLQKHTRKLKK